MVNKETNWPLGYLASVATGSLTFSVIGECLSPVEQLWPLIKDHPILDKISTALLSWLFLTAPFSLIIVAIPFVIGNNIARYLKLKSLIYFVLAGALCGRATYWVLTLSRDYIGTYPSWLAGLTGGLTFWRVTVRSSDGDLAPPKPHGRCTAQ